MAWCVQYRPFHIHYWPVDNIPTERLVAENVFFSVNGREIVSNGTISLAKGTITGLLGRNGSGKSTLLKAVFGTQKVDDINIHRNGKAIHHAYSINGLINYLPQWNFMPRNMKLRTALRHHHVERAKILSDFPEMEQDLDLQVFETSGGRERLWSTLILLFADTKYTMLDEPFTHLAPAHIEKLKEILQREKQNKGILITDHLYKHLLELSDDIYLMKEGKSIFIKDRNDLALHGYIKNVDS